MRHPARAATIDHGSWRPHAVRGEHDAFGVVKMRCGRLEQRPQRPVPRFASPSAADADFSVETLDDVELCGRIGFDLCDGRRVLPGTEDEHQRPRVRREHRYERRSRSEQVGETGERFPPERASATQRDVVAGLGPCGGHRGPQRLELSVLRSPRGEPLGWSDGDRVRPLAESHQLGGVERPQHLRAASLTGHLVRSHARRRGQVPAAHQLAQQARLRPLGAPHRVAVEPILPGHGNLAQGHVRRHHPLRDPEPDRVALLAELVRDRHGGESRVEDVQGAYPCGERISEALRAIRDEAALAEGDAKVVQVQGKLTGFVAGGGDRRFIGVDRSFETAGSASLWYCRHSSAPMAWSDAW